MAREKSIISRKIHQSVEAELYDKDNITQALQELYMLLETEKITEEEFDEQEKVLLDRLDEIERRGDVDEEEQTIPRES